MPCYIYLGILNTMSTRLPNNKHIRTVTLCEGTPPGRGPDTGPVKLWAYGYDTLAQVFGTTVEAIRTRVSRGKLNPEDLKSVCEAYILHARNSERCLCGRTEQCRLCSL